MLSTDKLHETLMRDREAVRKALNNYFATLGGAIILAERDEDEEARRDHAASLTQVQGAKRVLWMEG